MLARRCDPSAAEVTIFRSMFLIEATCGEEPCEVALIVVGTLEELDVLACDECGHCLHVLSISAAEYVGLAPPPTPLLLAA